MIKSGPSEFSPRNQNAPPPIVPDHHLLRRIGRGSFGDVWLALNAMHKWTAVKIVYRLDHDGGYGYEREFLGLQRYDELSGTDGSLMPIKNVGRNDEADFFYYAMELADDSLTRAPLPRPKLASEDLAEARAIGARYKPWTLSEELKQSGRLTPAKCIENGVALATALHQLHKHGLVHRDIKPSNIIFASGIAKLADVGLIQDMDATIRSLAGTPGFVPLHGGGEPSGDLFALGKVLYLMSTGNKVEDFPKEIAQRDRLSPAEQRELAELQAVFDRACAPVPADRQPSATVLREELEMLRKNESVVRLRILETERERWVRRRRRFVVGSLAASPVALVAIGVLLVYTWRLRTEHAATLKEMEASQLSRRLVHRAGWSRGDWARVAGAARSRMDYAVARQAVSTMSGLDAEIVHRKMDVEAASAAFSDDGRIVLSGFRGHQASLLADGTNHTTLAVAGEGKVCWADAGEPLIFVPEKGACVLREARTGLALRSLPLRDGEVVKYQAGPVMAANSDGSLLAACLIGGTNRVVLWDGQGHVLAELPVLATALAFSPDSRLLALGRSDGTIEVFRTHPFQRDATLPAAVGPNPIQGLAFGEDRKTPLHDSLAGQRWLIAAADQGTGIVVWDLSARIPRSFCRGSNYSVQSVAFHPDGLTLASAGRVDVHFWDVMTGTELLVTSGPGSATRGLAFNREGTQLIVGATSEDFRPEICLWRVESHRGVLQLRGLGAAVRKVWFSPDGRLIGGLSDQWVVAIWESRTGNLRRLIEVPTAGYADSAGRAFDEPGQRLAFSAGGEARVVDVNSGRLLETWRLPPGFNDDLQFDNQGRLFLTRCEPDKALPDVRRWILYELQPGQVSRVHGQTDTNSTVVTSALAAGARNLLIITHDRTSGFNSVRSIDISSGRELWTHPTQRRKTWDFLRLDPTGTRCAYRLTEENQSRAVVNISDGRRIALIPEGCHALSPVVREYAADGSGSLKHLDDPTREIPFASDENPASDTHTYSPDGRQFAWGAGTAVMVQDIETVRAKLKALRR